MKVARAILLGMSMIGASAIWAAAQGVVAVQWHQDSDDRQAYREGYRQGQWDARHGRRADWDDNRWREGDDRRAYRDGYLRGYREVNGTYRGDRDGDGYYVETAHRIGYQDGFNDGLRDRRSGHSFRPTHDDHYEDANRGYDGRFGNKSYYKQLYREAYRSGYEQGYGNGWRPY